MDTFEETETPDDEPTELEIEAIAAELKKQLDFSITSEKDSLVAEQLRTERLKTYIAFLDRFVPVIGASRPAEGEPLPVDEDLDSARNLACTAAFRVINAQAITDMKRAEQRGKEARDAETYKVEG